MKILEDFGMGPGRSIAAEEKGPHLDGNLLSPSIHEFDDEFIYSGLSAE